MRVTTGTVVNGRIEVRGKRLPEGAEVTISPRGSRSLHPAGGRGRGRPSRAHRRGRAGRRHIQRWVAAGAPRRL